MNQYIKITISSIPIAIGILYLIGIIFSEAYYSVYGLDSDQFQRDFNDTIVSGVLAIVLIGGEGVIYLCISIILLTVAAIAIWKLRARYEKSSHEKYLKRYDSIGNRNNNDESQSLHSGGFSTAAIIVELSSTVLSVFLLLIFSIAILTWGVSFIGKDIAYKYLDRIESDSWSHDSQYDVSLKLKIPEKIPIKRRLIVCTPKQCVFLTQEGVETIGRHDIHIIQTKVRI